MASVIDTVISFLNGPTIGIQPMGSDIIKPQITIDERYNNSLVITDHPVDKNANITDHAYKQPDKLTLSVAWSETPTIEILSSPANFLNQFKVNNMMDIFDMFSQYQNNRILCTVYTYKKVYRNMLIENISSYTDDETYRAMFMTLSFKEVIIARTQSVAESYPNSSDPKSSSNPVNSGSQNVLAGNPSNSSILGAVVS